MTGDFRYARSDIETTALHFVINDDQRTLGGFVGVPNPNVLSGVTVAPADVNNVNYTGVPILVNNPGEGLKDMDEVSMKLDVATDAGTFTSITAYDDLHELLTGDAFDFRPIGQSFNEIFFPRFQNPQLPPLTPNPFFGDWNQAQYLEVSSVSQEFRFTSPETDRVRWIAGAYFIQTDRFIGTGNLLDTGNGVARVYKVPRTTTGFPFDLSIPNPQVTYLSDSQDNFAWAVFGQLGFDINDQWDATFSLRYDEDEREQTTETPPGFIPAVLASDLVTGQKRKETWDATQPKATLRWRPNDNTTIYGDLSRGFRSGGFNQSGVALAGVAGVFNTFDEQIADTIEIGWKRQFADGRVSTSLAYYTTDLTGAYYFIFLVASSTQNLGSLDEVEYDGLEFELNALLTDKLQLEPRHRHDEQRDHGRCPDPARRRPGSAADVGLHVQPRRQLDEADVERPRVRLAQRPAQHRRHVLGSGRPGGLRTARVESDRARSRERRRPARRLAGRRLVRHRLGEEPLRRGIQRRVLAPVRLEGAAAALGHPVHEGLLAEILPHQVHFGMGWTRSEVLPAVL